MADKKKKNLPPEAQRYQAFQQKRDVKSPLVKNCIKACLVGGFICFIVQLISKFYIYFFDFNEQTTGNIKIAILIFILLIISLFRVYVRIDHFSVSGNTVIFIVY